MYKISLCILEYNKELYFQVDHYISLQNSDVLDNNPPPLSPLYESSEGTCEFSEKSKGKSLYRFVRSVPLDSLSILTDYKIVPFN